MSNMPVPGSIWTSISQQGRNNTSEIIDLSSDSGTDEEPTDKAQELPEKLSGDPDDDGTNDNDDDIIEIVILRTYGGQQESDSPVPSPPSTLLVREVEIENPVQISPPAEEALPVNMAPARRDQRNQEDRQVPEVSPQESIEEIVDNIIGRPESFVTFFDPNGTNSDIIYDDDREGSQSTSPHKGIEAEKENNSTPSPQPSTSKNCRRRPWKRKKVVTDSSDSEEVEDDNDEPKIGGGKRSRRKLSLRSSTSGTDSDDEDDDDDQVPLRTKRKRDHSKKKKRSSDRDLRKKKGLVISDRTPPQKESRKKREKQKLQKTLRSTTERMGGKKLSQRELALEKLRMKMEARKAKDLAREKSPPREKINKKKEESDDSDASSESVYSTGSFVVDDDKVELSFDGSTPTSSSVTSSGDEDEVPDLESGSEGEKDVEKEDSEEERKADEEEAAKSDRTSSSSEDEAPGPLVNSSQEDWCLLCKELGSRTFEGRRASENTSWCRCGECKIFNYNLKDYDLVCCKDVKTVVAFREDELDEDICITKHSRFQQDVLENGGYARSISKAPTFDHYRGGGVHCFFEYIYSNNAKNERSYDNAKAAFKNSRREDKYWKSLSSFNFWIFDRITAPADQKIPIPACVVAKIRETFEMGNHPYRPFRTQFQCPNAQHCMLTFDNTDYSSYYHS